MSEEYLKYFAQALDENYIESVPYLPKQIYIQAFV